MGLLIYRLMILLNTAEPSSTQHHIAQTLLEHLDEIDTLSISEMAALCMVSKSTLSKFAKDLGFDSYIELKDLSPFIENRYNFDQNYLSNIVSALHSNGMEFYLDAVQKDITSLRSNLDMEAIDRLARDLVHYQKVAAFGLLFSGTAALDLQGKLAYSKKFIYTSQSDQQQEEFILQADEETLLIIFSNSGNFITKYQMSEVGAKKKVFAKTRGKVFLITSNPDMVRHPDIDDCILFEHTTFIQTHSILYQIIMDLVVLRYRVFLENK